MISISIDSIKEEYERMPKSWHLASDADLQEFTIEQLMEIANSSSPYEPEENEVICVMEHAVIPVGRSARTLKNSQFIVRSQNEYIPVLLKEIDLLRNHLSHCKTRCQTLESQKNTLESDLEDLKKKYEELEKNNKLLCSKKPKKSRWTE